MTITEVFPQNYIISEQEEGKLKKKKTLETTLFASIITARISSEPLCAEEKKMETHNKELCIAFCGTRLSRGIPVP